jgi:hypothetical protein
MSTIYDLPNDEDVRSKFLENLPSHRTFLAPIQRPETWFETIFGPSPKIDSVPRYVYENRKKDSTNI